MIVGHAQPQLTHQVWLRAILAPAVIFILLFATAGHLDYWSGWGYMAIVMVTLLATWLVMRSDPALIAERLQPGQGMKGWDRWYFATSTPLYLATLVIAALDAGRWHWSDLPLWVYLLGVIIYSLGQALFLWAKRTNRYFSSVVRIQLERGQRVCQDGPYRIVRHPGYVAGLLFGITTPLVLGSYWGLIPAALAGALLIARTAMEDRTLQRELPGYTAYTQTVRHRLIPGLW